MEKKILQKKAKSILSIFLAVYLMLAIFPATVFAAENDESYSYSSVISTAGFMSWEAFNAKVVVNYVTLEAQISPYLYRIEGKNLKQYATLEDGYPVVVYPNKTVTGGGYTFIYVESKVGDGYVWSDYIAPANGSGSNPGYTANFTVTFDGNGGTVPIVGFSVTNGSHYGTLPIPTRTGHTFDGWYTAVSGGSQVTESTTVNLSANQTLYAHWTIETYTYPVVFDSRGGSLSIYTKDVVVGQPYGELFIPTKNGYTFNGWYTAAEGGKQITSSTIVGPADPQILYAHWASAATYTVKFDLNGMNGIAPESQEVLQGNTLRLPDLPKQNGYRCLGWYYSSNGSNFNLWSESNPVTQDMTLYAKWDYDRFSFSNHDSSFGSNKTYAITGKYLDALRVGLNSANWAKIQAKMDDSWHGSCFGMSVIYCLCATGRLDPAVFQNIDSSALRNNGNYLYDFVAPKDNMTVWNLVNYYFLQQHRPESNTPGAGRNNASTYWPNLLENGEYSRCLVEDLMSTGKPSEISFIYDDGAHAVVGVDCTRRSDGSYAITIWDPNSTTNDTLIISSDYKTASFLSGRYSNTKIFGSMPSTSASSTYDHINIQSYLLSNSTSLVEYSDVNMASLEITTDNFTVTTADGTYAEIKNGEVVGGNLEVAIGVSLTGSTSGTYSFFFPESSSYTITTSSDITGETVLCLDQYYVKVKSSGLKALAVTSDGEVKTSSSVATQQTITITSDLLGNEWNTLVVSGKDTGFSLKPENNFVTVKSDNAVSVIATGSDVFSGKSSSMQSLDVSPEGTKVPMGNLSSGSSSTIPSIPSRPLKVFSDVPSTQWSYPYITALTTSGALSGYPDGTFRPSNPVTLGEALKLIMWVANPTEYSDLPATSSHWASGYLDRAIKDGLLPTNTDTGLDRYTDRYTIAEIAAKAMKLAPVQNPACSPFADMPLTNASTKYVLSLYNAEIVTGSVNKSGQTVYYGINAITREEFATIVWRIQSYMQNGYVGTINAR